MILIFFYFLSISSVLSQSCQNNFTYGPNCTQTCNNCLYGCDISGSCINSLCKPQYYGNICNRPTPQPNKPSVAQSAPPTCNALVSVDQYNSTTIYQKAFYVQFNGNNLSTPMTVVSSGQRYEQSIPISPSSIITIGIYFVFETLDLYGDFLSLVSPLYRATVSANCIITETNISVIVTPSPVTTQSTGTTTGRPTMATVPPIIPTSPITSSSGCQNNFTYGVNCTQTCNNCLYGCDISGSCINSFCKPEYYGNICNRTTPQPNKPSVTQSSPLTCNALISVDQYNSTTINPKAFYIQLNDSNLSTPMTLNGQRYEQSIPISPLSNNKIGIYFVFETLDLYGDFRSLVSPLYGASVSANCMITEINSSTIVIPTTVTTQQTGTTVSRPSVATVLPINPTTSTTSPAGPLFWDARTWTLSWTFPANRVGLTSFQIIVNGTLLDNTPPERNIFNLSQLNFATLYNVVVNSVYSTSTISNSMLLWTKPMPFSVPLPPPQISSILENQFLVIFPTYSNYSGVINTYYIAVVKNSSTTTRFKRDTLSCSNVDNIPLVPSGALFYYASNVAPSASGVTIGSGSTYPTLHCPNNQLEASTNYRVYSVVGSIVNGVGEYSVSQNDITTSPASNVGMIVGIVLGILLLLLIIAIILLIYFLKCRKRPGVLYGIKGLSEEFKPMSHLYWSSIIDKMDSRQIFLDDKTIHDGLTFKDEYDNLPPRPCDDHVSAEFVVLNHSHDHSKEAVMQDFGSLSYRATFIDGYIKKREFISLQTPYNEQTVSDFWLMVFNENVGQIVTITQEGQSLKQTTYWPSKSQTFDEIEVSVIAEDHFAYFDVRQFKIRKFDSNENIKVTQYHYRSWPSDDKYVNIIPFLDFHEFIKKSESIVFGPTIVHCQFGCPLNAVYMGFDILNNQILKEKEVNVFRVMAQLRRHRPNTMVNINQYMVIYDLLFESYLSGGFSVDSSFKKLMNSSSVTFWRFLENQFRFLNDFRNITTQTAINNNAFFIFDSEEYQDSIILSKSLNYGEDPLNLWRTVFNNNVSIIIDLTNGDSNKTFYNAYKLNIQVENVVEHQYRVLEQRVSVTNTESYENRTVTVYSVNSHNGGECASWIELISSIIDNVKYKVLVFDCEGSCLSTVFIACFNAAFKLNKLNFVSVFYTIRALQSSGHPIISTKEDLKLIFQFLEMWIDSKMYDLIPNREKKLDFYDRDFPFTNGPYGETNFGFSNDFSQSPYGTVNKPYKMTENLYNNHA